MQKLTRWGNSTGLRIPLPVLEAAGLKPGSYVSIRLLNSGDIRVRPAKNAQIVTEEGTPLRQEPITPSKW